MNDILIWRSANRLVASFTDHKPKLLFNEHAASVKSSLGDYDYITSNDRLVGFSFAVTERDIAGIAPLIDRVENVQFDAAKNEMRIVMEDKIDGPLDIKCVQASSVVYWARGKPVGIGLSKWTNWGDIGFPILPLVTPSQSPQ